MSYRRTDELMRQPRASEQREVVGEIQSLTELAPSQDELTIDAYEAQRVALGLRYTVKTSVVILAEASRVFRPGGNGYSEMRLGLEISTMLE